MAKMATIYVENIFAADFDDKLLNCTTACLDDQSLAGTGTQCCLYVHNVPTDRDMSILGAWGHAAQRKCLKL